MKKKLYSFFTAVIMLFVTAGIVNASSVLEVSFAEIAQRSDLIFIGTADKQINRVSANGRMAFTDVFFKDVKVISATARSKQKNLSVIRLSVAGGRVGDYYVEVSGTPRFENGKRYLICAYDDGEPYGSPVVGDAQGMFTVIQDTESSEEYVATTDGRIVVGADSSGFFTTGGGTLQVRNGSIVFDEDPSSNQFGHAPPAIPSNESGAVLSVSKKDNYHIVSRPLRLQEAVNYIKEVALKQPIKNKRLLSGEGKGFSYRREGDKIIKEENKPSKMPATDSLGASPVAPRSDLGACGFQFLPIVMEQVADTDPYYDTNNRCMGIWNRYMDIYRVARDDGRYYFRNLQSEFCGFVSDDNLEKVYGMRWPETWIAACATLKPFGNGGCGVIVESDIVLNPQASFTDDPAMGLAGTFLYLMQPTIMHELGHSWGEQLGIFEETYKYDYPSVMHRIHSGIIEDGYGVHAVDAFLLRRIYSDQVIISPITDIGVESYYASSLNPSSTTRSSLFNASVDREDCRYYPGQEITFQDITVENNSYSSVSNLQLRIYLSPVYRALTDGSYEVDNYWYWPSFPMEDLVVGSYKTTLPKEIPSGTYYIIASVTIDGDKQDDYTSNNITSFYKQITIVQPPPEISSVSTTNKQLLVSGKNFVRGSLVLLNGTTLVTTNDQTDPTTNLIADLTKKLKNGETVVIQVDNPDGSKSNEFRLTK